MFFKDTINFYKLLQNPSLKSYRKKIKDLNRHIHRVSNFSKRCEKESANNIYLERLLVNWRSEQGFLLDSMKSLCSLKH
jgi:hypothetical protein